MAGADRREVEDAVTGYRDTMARARRGEVPFADAAHFYTEDAVYEEPISGRTTGGTAIVRGFEESAAGMPGWQFPPTWTLIDGERVVYGWDTTVPGVEGARRVALSGVAVLTYAGSGRFSHHVDVYDSRQLFEIFTAEAGGSDRGST